MRRKSALQINCRKASTATVKPNVASKELKGVMAKRASTACMATPSNANSGTRPIKEISGSTPTRVLSS